MYVNNRPKRENQGLDTGTVCAGSSNLLLDPASIFASSFFLMYVQETRHIIVRKPTNAFRMERGERRCNILLQSGTGILIDFDDSMQNQIHGHRTGSI